MRPVQRSISAFAALLIALTRSLAAQNVCSTAMAGTANPLAFIYTAYCNTGEALVGLHGKADRLIDRGAYCVRVRSAGQWDGEVRVTVGIIGRSGTFVDSFELLCRT